MESSLRNRLTFGPLMLAGLFLLLWLDDATQRWTRDWMQKRYADESFRGGIGGVGILVLLAIILPIATQELSILFTAERVRPYRILAALGSSLLILHAWLTPFPPFRLIAASAFPFIVVFIMLLAVLRRALRKQTQYSITAMAATAWSA